MKALNLYALGDLRYEETPVPEPEADEVLIKVLAAGICGSDVPRVFSKGAYHYPIIIGHEFAGLIIAVGSDENKDLLGRKAAVFPLLPCFKCEMCKKEEYAACCNYDYYGSRRDGAFAEYIAVKVWNLVFVPDGVPVLWAAMTEPCAVAIHAAERADIKKGDMVCIFGAGPIGLIIAQLAKGFGAGKIIILDKDDNKLGFALGIGFEDIISTLDADYQETILRLTEGRGADVCVDAAGVPATVAGCLNAAGPFARILLMGNPSGDILLKQDVYWQILRKQLTLTGTWNSSYGSRRNDWKTALFHMESGAVDLSGFITQIFPLKEGKNALELMRDNNDFYVKVMLAPHEGALEGLRTEIGNESSRI